jgi:divalent metal cation (Fe/Co/Zn/Cd) transporter
MADEMEGIKNILHELEKNRLVKKLEKDWHELSKMAMYTDIVLLCIVLITILLLNWLGKLSNEANGWLLAALIGYIFGRGAPE